MAAVAVGGGPFAAAAEAAQVAAAAATAVGPCEVPEGEAVAAAEADGAAPWVAAGNMPLQAEQTQITTHILA